MGEKQEKVRRVGKKEDQVLQYNIPVALLEMC
jgi:hypothetical protein